MESEWNKSLNKKRITGITLWSFNLIIFTISLFLIMYTEEINHWSCDAWKAICFGSGCFKIIASIINIYFLLFAHKNNPSEGYRKNWTTKDKEGRIW